MVKTINFARSVPQGDELKRSVLNKTWTRSFRKMIEKMPENMRRWNAALLAIQYGHGGMKLAQELSGLSQVTLRKGRRELEQGEVDWDSDCVRHSGGGRKLLEENDPELFDALKELVADETAGDPSSADRWVKRSSRKLAKALNKLGYRVSHASVIRLLKKLD